MALMSAFQQQAQVGALVLSLGNPVVLAGLLMGGILSFLLSSMAMQAVGEAVSDMIKEVRRWALDHAVNARIPSSRVFWSANRGHSSNPHSSVENRDSVAASTGVTQYPGYDVQDSMGSRQLDT